MIPTFGKFKMFHQHLSASATPPLLTQLAGALALVCFSMDCMFRTVMFKGFKTALIPMSLPLCETEFAAC